MATPSGDVIARRLMEELIEAQDVIGRLKSENAALHHSVGTGGGGGGGGGSVGVGSSVASVLPSVETDFKDEVDRIVAGMHSVMEQQCSAAVARRELPLCAVPQTEVGALLGRTEAQLNTALTDQQSEVEKALGPLLKQVGDVKEDNASLRRRLQTLVEENMRLTNVAEESLMLRKESRVERPSTVLPDTAALVELRNLNDELSSRNAALELRNHQLASSVSTLSQDKHQLEQRLSAATSDLQSAQSRITALTLAAASSASAAAAASASATVRMGEPSSSSSSSSSPSSSAAPSVAVRASPPRPPGPPARAPSVQQRSRTPSPSVPRTQALPDITEAEDEGQAPDNLTTAVGTTGGGDEAAAAATSAVVPPPPPSQPATNSLPHMSARPADDADDTVIVKTAETPESAVTSPLAGVFGMKAGGPNPTSSSPVMTPTSAARVPATRLANPAFDLLARAKQQAT